MPDIREIQLAQISIMKEIVNVCDRHRLTYYLSYGTLLGAVRHGGFIPWDDDLDLEMPWRDYRKFIRYAKKELPADLFVQTFYTDAGYPNAFLMVRKNGTCAMPVSAKALDIHWGVEVDIFPLTGLYRNKKLRSFQIKRMKRLSKILQIEYKRCTQPDVLQTDPVYRQYAQEPLKRRIGFCRFLMFLLTRSLRPDKISPIAYGLQQAYDAKDYGSAVKMKFEDGEYNVPVGYHNILTAIYGDYMTPPPENERGGHELTMGDIIWDLEQDYSCYR